MPRLHVIVGDANTRKSSLLRCLTGVVGGRSANQLMDVLLSSGSIVQVFCTTSALQESLDPKQPQRFIADVLAMKPVPTDVAITLRLKNRASYPAATAYFAAFASAGWSVSSVALLGSASSTPVPVGARAVSIPASMTQPTNESAASVRKVWGWV